uniref:F-box domain-containing protein n=1 Tax=Caenorhabditis tropicalis TaxID=1561998 RepID=A0A1I7TZ93_9PELO
MQITTEAHGKKKEFLPVREEDHIDIQLTCYDQNLIIDSYNSSRSKRVQQRDPLHPAHPMIPLRNMPHDISSTTEGFEDSSEDELREKREKMKKSRMVFANCYMCQVDPSVQHLHTLGNGADIEKLKKRRRTEQIIDKFHEKLNLKISNFVENVPESTLKSENIREIKKGGTFYTLKCLKTVRRAEYGDHCLSQHTNSVDLLNEMVLRCPNWERGCPFVDSRVRVKTGKLRFHVFTSTLTHEPLPDYNREQRESSKWNLENLPLWVYESLVTYLPSSALYNLSLTNKKMRHMAFMGCPGRCYVEPVWKSDTFGSWMQDGFVWKISSTEAPPALEWNIPSQLSQHISKCSYFDAVTYEEKSVAILPPFLDEELRAFFKVSARHEDVQRYLLNLQDR